MPSVAGEARRDRPGQWVGGLDPGGAPGAVGFGEPCRLPGRLCGQATQL
jgi:hypothetical protein